MTDGDDTGDEGQGRQVGPQRAQQGRAQMVSGTAITAVTARQVFSDRGHPGIEATVTTESGARGVAICTAGVSVGQHEVEFAYDGGPKWRGRGVQRAVANVNDVI